MQGIKAKGAVECNACGDVSVHIFVTHACFARSFHDCELFREFDDEEAYTIDQSYGVC